MPDVDSEAVARLGYDPGRAVLTVTFRTGRVYAYRRVPPGVYRAFLAAPSKGRFFNAEIRDRYDYREVRRPH